MWKDNLRILASRLSPVKPHRPYFTSMHLHFVQCDKCDVKQKVQKDVESYKFVRVLFVRYGSNDFIAIGMETNLSISQ